MSTGIAVQRTISDIIEEYETKRDSLPNAIEEFQKAATALRVAGTVNGTFVEPVLDSIYIYEDNTLKKLLKSAWQTMYNRLRIDMIATAKDKDDFKKFIQDPIEMDYDAVVDVFGDYFLKTRFHVLRGLAECFTGLDNSYKSHSNVKIGVEGLPKRIILSGYSSLHSNYRMVDKVGDIINALAVYRGHEMFSQKERQAIHKYFDSLLRERTDFPMLGNTYTMEKTRYTEEEEIFLTYRGITLRGFLNGNLHIIFDKITLIDINKGLSEFYGDVLPDIEPEETVRNSSTAVSKDLQFYWTPDMVISQIINKTYLSKKGEYQYDKSRYKVLEPSCGDGRILDFLKDYNADTFGIEYDIKRSNEARAKGHNVLQDNFLEVDPTPEYDLVIMNPPFNQYKKHIEHAKKFLKSGGQLICVLPANAHYHHKDTEGNWYDLPVASFRDSGTNVPTGYMVWNNGR